MNRFRSLVLIMGLAACSTVNTAPDEVALHYSAGPMSDTVFDYCVPVSTRDNWQGPGDFNYYYPVGQRDFKFSTDEGSDFGPLTTSTKDSVELTVKGTVYFTINTNCSPYRDKEGKEWPGGKLQKFHERLGLKNHVPGVDTNGVGDGWKEFLNKYIKDVVDRTVDLEASRLGYSDLYNNADVRAKWETSVVTSVVDQVQTAMGEDFLKIDRVILQKPDLPDAMKNELVNAEAARLRANTSLVDQEAAKNFPGGLPAYVDYQAKQAVNKAISEGKVPLLPVPYGSSIIVNTAPGQK